MQGLTDKIFEFRNGEVKEFLGTIDEYLEARKFEDFRQVEKQEEAKAAAAEIKGEKSNDYELRKQLDKDIRKAENQVSKLEKEVEKLETEISDLDEKLHDPVQFKELSQQPDFYEKYEAKKASLDQLMKEWEDWQLKLDEAQESKAALES